MLSRIVECVPNFSEARRPEIIENILECINSVPNIYVLDQHSDIDHNRTVITFVGEPGAVAEAAFQAILSASKLINLNLHSGEHPRIGATDVVPFIPIRNVTMQECIEMARDLGQRVGNELGIPVYLYEEASTRPERKDLENIRRGEYEQLIEEIQTNPERQPDYGPSKVGAAGATAIGARQFLVAFNVFLNTDDIRVAQKIAKSIRNSSGGWHFLKAKGFLVEGRAQVSMNFTNFRYTSLARVVEYDPTTENYTIDFHGLFDSNGSDDLRSFIIHKSELESKEKWFTQNANTLIRKTEKELIVIHNS
jgi:glutamate formiminotransferase/formiminotetrahydrofolate cyclodeaminase